MAASGTIAAVLVLRPLLADVAGSCLLLHDSRGDEAGLAALAHECGAALRHVGTEVDSDRRAVVALALRDVVSLRRAASVLPRIGTSRVVALWLDEAEQPPVAAARPEWPRLRTMTARSEGAGALTVLRFRRPARVASVVQELARAAVPSRVGGGEGLWTARAALSADQAPPVDPLLAELAAGIGDSEAPVPPDVVLGDTPGAETVSQVTGRAPVVTRSILERQPLDEGVFNPIGFEPRPAHGVATLSTSHPVSASAVTRLRDHLAVRVSWDAAPTTDVAQTVAALAMAGIPVHTTVPPGGAGHLGQKLRAVLSETPDLTDALDREEHSVRLRRAALLEHSTLGWRTRLAAAAGVAPPRLPSCSVVLATRRPAMLQFALEQVAQQRSVPLQLVLVAHGFSADPGLVREQVADAVVLSMPEGAPFGSVLAAGVAAASGELVAKMDDDDWYGPHFLLDLLLARRYSGADLVGTSAEFVYLEALDRTIRRNDPSERFAAFVAGGTMLVDRTLLQAVGGFRPVRRFVDAQLLYAVRAVGGSVYRAAGLGYVLRRGAAGHTWAADEQYFLDPARLDRTWDGFVPSRELRLAEAGAA